MMKTTTVLAPLAALALLVGSPAGAQDDGAEKEAAADAAEQEVNPFALFGSMFAVEPLSDEQLSRLPLATAIIAKLMPEGAMAEMMGSMFDRFMKPIAALPKDSAKTRVARSIGYDGFDLELDEAQARELADLFDPAFEEREARTMAAMPEMMASAMAVMEPPMRKAMAELYAINFSTEELNDIGTFFSTPSGASYARKSFTMASDPRVVAATMEAMPAMMGPMAELEKKMKAATADLPPVRTYAELTAAERARITALTGLSSDEIEQALEERSGWAEGAEGPPPAATEKGHVH